MKINKLEEILMCLKDKDSNIILDTSNLHEECLNNTTYELTTVSIEERDKGLVIKLGFNERISNSENKHSQCRIKNIDLSSIREGKV